MTHQIIITVVALIMLVIAIIRDDKWSTLLTGLLTFCFFTNWLNFEGIKIVGYYTYMAWPLMLLVYSFFQNKLDGSSRVLIALTGLWVAMVNLAGLMYWPYGDQFRLSLIFPFIFYLVLLSRGLVRQKELSFMTLINTELILRILHHWN